VCILFVEIIIFEGAPVRRQSGPSTSVRESGARWGAHLTSEISRERWAEERRARRRRCPVRGWPGHAFCAFLAFHGFSQIPRPVAGRKGPAGRAFLAPSLFMIDRAPPAPPGPRLTHA
jgi:hypothetical protein